MSFRACSTAAGFTLYDATEPVSPDRPSGDAPAALPDLLDALAERRHLVRVARDDDQVGDLALLDGAESVVDAEELGRASGRRLERRSRRHPARDHQLELAEVATVGRDPRVSAHRDADTCLDRLAERGPV